MLRSWSVTQTRFFEQWCWRALRSARAANRNRLRCLPRFRRQPLFRPRLVRQRRLLYRLLRRLSSHFPRPSRPSPAAPR